jgi:hypothetical protein
MKIGNVKISGKYVKRKLNHHIVTVLEPTKKISYEEATKKAKEILKG